MPSNSHHGHRQKVLDAPDHGPSLRAVPFGPAATKTVVHLLSNPQRLQLAGIATRLRLPAGTIVYREESVAEWLFIVGHGVAKAFCNLPSGNRRVMSFLFADDVFGLAECGRYVNTVQAITPVSLYRVRVDRLLTMLRHDSSLEFQFLSKVVHELRESLLRTIVLSRRDAVGRVAMFLRMLAQHARHKNGDARIEIPMSRSDIASFLGLSLDAVIRASRRLEETGLVAFDGRHAVRILNRRRFDGLVAAH